MMILLMEICLKEEDLVDPDEGWDDLEGAKVGREWIFGRMDEDWEDLDEDKVGRETVFGGTEVDRDDFFEDKFIIEINI